MRDKRPMPYERPMRPLPRDGSLIRVKLTDGTLACACWCENHYDEETHPHYHGIEGPEFDNAGWVIFGLLRPPSVCASTSWIAHQEEERIAAWAPMRGGNFSPYSDDLTELIDEAAGVEEIAKEAWFIWQKMGHPPRFAWETEAKANREARTLARRYPGNSFLVMRAMRKFRVEPVMEAIADEGPPPGEEGTNGTDGT